MTPSGQPRSLSSPTAVGFFRVTGSTGRLSGSSNRGNYEKNYNRLSKYIPFLLCYLRDSNHKFVKFCFRQFIPEIAVYKSEFLSIGSEFQMFTRVENFLKGFCYLLKQRKRKKNPSSNNISDTPYLSHGSSNSPQRLKKRERLSHLSVENSGAFGKKQKRLPSTLELEELFSTWEVSTLCGGLLRMLQVTKLLQKLPPQGNGLDLTYAVEWTRKLDFDDYRVISELASFFYDLDLPTLFGGRYDLGSPSFPYFVKNVSNIFPSLVVPFSSSASGLRFTKANLSGRFIDLERELVDFFQCIDPDYCSVAHKLVRFYELPDLALGVIYKFKALPYAWKARLLHLQSPEKWLNKRVLKKVRFIQPNAQVSLKILLTEPPKEVQIEMYKRQKRFRDDKKSLIIKEYIAFEKRYLNILTRFVTDYLSEIEKISQCQLGPMPQEALGLTPQELERVMQPIKPLVKSLQRWMITLSIVTLLPGSQGVIRYESKSKLLATLFLENSQRFQLYLQGYYVNYKNNKNTLEELVTRFNIRPSEGVHKSPRDPQNFLEIYAQFQKMISQTNNNVLGYDDSRTEMPDLDSVLEAPIHHTPKIGLFFERLLKVEEPHSPEAELLSKAQKEFNNVMNLFLRLYESASGFLAKEAQTLTIILDQVMIVTGAFGAVSQGAQKWVFFLLSFAAGTGLYANMFYLAKESYKLFPPEARTSLLIVNLLFFCSWIIFPILWVVGSPGLNVIDQESDTIAHCIGDFVAKNVFGLAAWYVRWNFDYSNTGKNKDPNGKNMAKLGQGIAGSNVGLTDADVTDAKEKPFSIILLGGDMLVLKCMSLMLKTVEVEVFITNSSQLAKAKMSMEKSDKFDAVLFCPTTVQS
eukprot:augustus_masked-scaffold_1-processed-gene-26.7-mRNA-1 protein AED:1.00 eAED:1.00 QI:0/0/0/0/1/1/3/459/862